MFGILVSLYFINNFYKHCCYYYNSTEKVCLSSLFVRCLDVRGFLGRHLTLSVLKNTSSSVTWHILVQCYSIFSSRLSNPSRPMPYYPRLLPSCLQRASWFCRSPSSRPNFLHSERPLDGAACFFHWQIFRYRSKICPGDEPGKQMASTEDPLKRKINCSWGEFNPDCPVANMSFYL